MRVTSSRQKYLTDLAETENGDKEIKYTLYYIKATLYLGKKSMILIRFVKKLK